MHEYYWTVGNYRNNPETLDQAKARAERECTNTRKATYLYKLIDVCHPGEPHWDSAPAPAEPERYKAGQIVDADWNSRYDDLADQGRDWREAKIIPWDGGYWMVEFTCEPGQKYEMRSDELRCPIVTAPKPLAFGDRVRADGQELPGVITSSIKNNHGEWMVSFPRGIDTFLTHVHENELTHI